MGEISLKWYLKVVDAIPSIVAVVILVFGLAILKHLDNKKQHALEKMAILHVETVRATDKNCNDCHLGASFVNLFNHPAVKGNDNTVNLMMDKAKIKRW